MAVAGQAKGLLKAGGAAGFGLLTGAVMMYSRAAVERVSKLQPLANFSVGAKDGLSVTFHNQAVGESGYWDFGDGSPLEPFAPDQPVTHTYPKPGAYTAKLTVRNFLQEEKERAVPVEVEAAATPAANLLPAVTLSVQPVGKASVAPATFRLVGEVRNAERAFLDLGDKVEVVENGPFDRYVVMDKPTRHPTPIQLIGHSGKQVVKESAVVSVAEDRAGTLAAVVTVVDSGTRPTREAWPELVDVVATKGVKTFQKTVTARPGWTLTGFKLVGPPPKGVAKLTLTAGPDKRSAVLAGEWVGAAGEVLVPVSLTGERATAVSLPQHAAAALDAQGNAVVPLPPRPRDAAGLTRRVALTLRQVGPDGKPQTVASNPDLGKPWQGKLPDGRAVRAEVAGEQVRIGVGR